jgi:hypothetical protein
MTGGTARMVSRSATPESHRSAIAAKACRIGCTLALSVIPAKLERGSKKQRLEKGVRWATYRLTGGPSRLRGGRRDVGVQVKK